jgi:hypothetical protein
MWNDYRKGIDKSVIVLATKQFNYSCMIMEDEGNLCSGIIQLVHILFFFHGSSSPFRAQASYSIPKSFCTDGMTHWMGDQPVARPFINKGQHKQNKRIHTPNIHALNGIRTHDPSVRESEDRFMP